MNLQSAGISPKKLREPNLDGPNSRVQRRGLVNSHSNKRLPTDKETSLLEMGRLSQPGERIGLADRSLDRVGAANLFAGRDIF